MIMMQDVHTRQKMVMMQGVHKHELNSINTKNERVMSYQRTLS